MTLFILICEIDLLSQAEQLQEALEARQVYSELTH